MRISSIVYCTLFIMVNSRKIQRRTKGKHRGIEFAKKRITNTRGAGSCYGYAACLDSILNIGDISCIGTFACLYSVSEIEDNSCRGGNSCNYAKGTIGSNSCLGERSCKRAHGTWRSISIGDNSCLGQESCYDADGTIGSNSCITDYSCQDHSGDIPSNCPSVEAMNAGLCIPLTTVGMNPTDALGQCEGDCDKNDDCNDDLVCYFRNGDTPIPGCGGDGISNYDYCVDLGSIPPDHLATVGKNPTQTLGQCQGDCDDHDDCAEGLVCHKRDGTSEIPGCQGIGHTNYDYCTSA